jgi:hypothetical protein
MTPPDARRNARRDFLFSRSPGRASSEQKKSVGDLRGVWWRPGGHLSSLARFGHPAAMRASLLVMLFSSIAFADAVPPPPRNCPPGQVGITSHGGPRCVPAAPKSCPAGWRPQIGGVCVVAVCFEDANCEAGQKCKQAEVCLQERLVEWGEAPQSRVDPFLFAEPPRHNVPPRKVIETIDVCGDKRSCPDDSKCDTGKICLPKGVDKPAPYSAKPKKK